MRVKSVAAGLLATLLASVIAVTSVQQPAVAGKAKLGEGLKAGAFNVASFNVLGHTHTVNGGRGMASSGTRMVWTKQLILKHRVNVAGFQEMQMPQVNRFLDLMDGSWRLYPGNTMKGLDADNSIGWNVYKWELVQATTVNVPYFDGLPRRMPVVLLRDRFSGMLVYFSNFHNPATNKKRGNQDRWRRAAENVEIALQNQLVSNGIPRIMTGDFNERSYVFCKFTGAAPLKAARPGSYRKGKTCNAGKPRYVDWIFGSLRGEFTHYAEDRSALNKKTSDHPVIVARYRVEPERLINGWQVNPPAPIVPRVSWTKP